MTVTIGALTVEHLAAQPLVYDEVDVYAGNTARAWEVQGFISQADFATLIGIYDTWRDLKIQEENPETALVQGATVSFTGTGPGGLTWSSVPVWFSSTPKATVLSSAWVEVSFQIVDAVQKIESFTKSAADSNTSSTADVDYGTYNLAGVTVDLTKYPYTFDHQANLEYTAGGYHYVSGSLRTAAVHDLEGYVNPSDAPTIQTWYENTIAATPSVGTMYPTSAPTFEGEYVGVNVKYKLSISLMEVL